MKRLFIAAVVLLLTAGLVYAKDYEISKKAGDYSIQIRMDKNPPVTGQNKIGIGIKDATGKDVTDATVAVDYGMPAMPGMPAMNYKTKTEMKGGRYMGTLDFSMSGPWFVTIKITRDGKTTSVKFNVDIG